MIDKVFILTLLIASISVSTASPVVREEEIPEYIEPTEPVEMNLTQSEFQGNESGIIIGLHSESCSPQMLFLTVNIKYASGLRDTDGRLNLPDPYVKVYAKSSHCGFSSTHFEQTHSLRGTTDPSWHKDLEFGWANWLSFNIQVWDKDATWDDAMTGVHTVYVRPGSYCDQRYYDSGVVTFDYFLQTPGEKCNGAVC